MKKNQIEVGFVTDAMNMGRGVEIDVLIVEVCRPRMNRNTLIR